MSPNNQLADRRTIDLSAKTWGCNAKILKIIDGGKRLRLATWSTPRPDEGDYLILKNGDGTTRYRADRVERQWGVDDMCIVDASFDPRQS